MYFDSIYELLTMGGHGPYVWAAYGIGLSVLVWNLFTPIFQGRKTADAIRRNARREQLRHEQLQREGR
ncbi:heme exporter protein CcmD [Parendozoicomonas sp. Alg238-R29]|uniref:heme exporter protein CcmD n=1 Tax=Parendozoicomonas sp. Alg238-R29 TaxID=2993446 RepID=UPI00248D9570|nr:heme exporter protein CcmD [Parendozoicomonas sp. Alg238-R29]